MATKQLSPLAFNPSAAPGSPANGWTYFDSTTKRVTSNDGAAWQTYLSRADMTNGAVTSITQTYSSACTVTPAGNTTWYRLGSLPAQSGNYGQYSEVFIRYNGANGIHYVKLTLSRVADDGIYDTYVTIETIGRYVTAGHGIKSIRVFDAEGGTPVYVDALFDDTSAATVLLSVRAVDMSANQSFSPASGALASQGTGASGSYTIILDTSNNDVVSGTTKKGAWRSSYDTLGNVFSKNFGYYSYSNSGAVTTVDWSSTGMQYVTVSAATNIAFSNGVANQLYVLVIKSSSGGPWIVTFTSMGTANVGTQWSVPASASGATAFLFIYTGSRWFLLGTDSATPNTNTYTFP